LKAASDADDHYRIISGFDWLCQNINADGGFGDTTGSESNVSTTLLCYAAVRFCQKEDNGLPVIRAMEDWLAGKGIDIDSETITKSILKFYGKDYTFCLPFAAYCVLHPWKKYPDCLLNLPFCLHPGTGFLT
jgi:squalene-hopene/tetraprenyl-beta-curcumene cyclase